MTFANRTGGRRCLPVLFLLAGLAGGVPAVAGEVESRQLIERGFPGAPIEAFRQLPGLPFYEAWIDRRIVYTDLDARVLIIGNLLDGKTLRNLREARVAELLAIPPKAIPLDTAIRTVRGKGRTTLVVFADPNCPYCKRYEQEIAGLDDVTIHTVMYPVLGPDSRDKARAILCAPDPGKAWRQWMADGKAPPVPEAGCQPSFDAVLAFGRKNDIGVTPTSFLSDGRRLAGFVPLVTLKSEMATRPQ